LDRSGRLLGLPFQERRHPRQFREAELIVVHDMDDGVFQHLASHSPFEED
jgi:hypothetical protein